MKLQIDTVNKTIKVEGNVNLNELFEGLKKLLPEEEWKGFTLESGNIIEWINPITIPIIPYYPTNPYVWPPYYPWTTSPIVTCADNSYTLTAGTYNIQI